jgi:recyclin-1
VQKICVLLFKVLGQKHLKPAFEEYVFYIIFRATMILSKSVPLDFVPGQKMVNNDSLQFFELVHVADLLHQMINVYYTEDIVNYFTDI